MIIVDISNFHSHVEKFCSEKSIDVCDNDIIIKMIKEGYIFSSIAPSIIKRALSELRIHATNGNHIESVSIIINELKPCPYCEKHEEKEREDYNNDSSDS